MATLYLGDCDSGKQPQNREVFLKPFHTDGLLIGKVSFRDDDKTTWRSFREGTGNQILKLQQFLHQAGFMPRCAFDGVFGYVTQAAVRLFQEYVRSLEQFPDMVPDGIVGSATMKHVERWQQENKAAEWGTITATNPTKQYTDWMNLLHQAKSHYEAHPGPILKHLNSLSKTYATRKPSAWTFNTNIYTL